MRHIDDAMAKFVDRAYKRRVENEQHQ
jgi:hypothetical protein